MPPLSAMEGGAKCLAVEPIHVILSFDRVAKSIFAGPQFCVRTCYNNEGSIPCKSINGYRLQTCRQFEICYHSAKCIGLNMRNGFRQPIDKCATREKACWQCRELFRQRLNIKNKTKAAIFTYAFYIGAINLSQMIHRQCRSRILFA